MSAPDLSGLRRAPGDRTTERATVPMPASRWRTRIALPLVVLLVFAGVLGTAAWDVIAPRTDVRSVPVIVKEGTTSSASVAFQASGWFEPDPFPVYASALTDGVVQEVLVLEGQTVAAGDVVARLVPDDARLSLEAAVARVAELEAQLAIAQAERTAAQEDWDNPTERERKLAVSIARVDAARADLERLASVEDAHESRVEELRQQLEREERAEGAIPEWDVARTRVRLATERATLKAVVAEQKHGQATIAEAEAETVAAEQDLTLRTDETLTLARAIAHADEAAAALRSARVAHDEAALRVRRLDIVAPVDGVVMQRLVAPGDKLMLGMDDMHSAHTVHLYDPQHLQVRVDVPLADAADVGVGQRAEIVAEVLPDRVFAGKVTRVVHKADIQKNTLQVKVRVTDPDAALKPEMLARVRFFGGRDPTLASTAQRVFAPERLLMARSGQSAQVWIVDKGDGTAVRRDVTLGSARQEGWVEVLAGLAPGDHLIADAPAELADGARVRVTGEAD